MALKAFQVQYGMAPSCSGEIAVCRTKKKQRSRYGCRNCKLRKLKCDESKPECKKCSAFGTLCNFKTGVPDLHPITDDSVRPLIVQKIAKLRPPPTTAVWTSDASTSYQLDSKCQDFVNRYLGRSLITPDDPNMAEINRKLLTLAFSHPFLMHASVAVALAHDHYLNSPLGCRRSREECFHWYQSTVLFNRRLKKPIETKHKDAIWGTAAALALLTFSAPDSHTPEGSWPLRASDPSDLEWLRISKGKMALWPIANPLRPDSIFCVLAPIYTQMNSPLLEKEIHHIPRDLATVCNIDHSSTAENNPYFNAAHAISQLQEIPDNEFTIGHSERFTLTINGPFRLLLQDKDPISLVLLYLWYEKAGQGIWWIEARARVECPAICTYLQLYHKGHNAADLLVSRNLDKGKCAFELISG